MRPSSKVSRLGLSPRGRGKPPTAAAEQSAMRSIPAWAGETASTSAAPTGLTVYPRVGGGNRASMPAAVKASGLSPRGRGKRRVEDRRRQRRGSIPAWAGETLLLCGFIFYPEVYPRVGGGNSSAKPPGQCLGGLSPRGRGKQPAGITGRPDGGSIPAWAGETAGRDNRPAGWGVYPRVGGGNLFRD